MKSEEIIKTAIICVTIIIGIMMINNKFSTSLNYSSTEKHQLQTLNVQWKWEVSITPDLANLKIGFSATRPTSKEAQDSVNLKVAEAQALLKNFSIKTEDIKTENMSINTDYDYESGKWRKINWYTANYSMHIIFRNLDNKSVKELEKLINQLTNIETVNIESIDYDVQDKAKIFTQTRELAMKKAKQKAEELAKLWEVEIWKPVIISEENGLEPFFFWNNYSQSNTASSWEEWQSTENSNISLWQLKISVYVNVSYQIK